jgi:hypothetical protein
MNKGVRLSCLVFGLLTFGCNQQPDGTTDAAATEQQSIWRGTSDDGPTADPYRNAIVQVAGCTGYYVTSRLIVTANHCVTGSNVGGGVTGLLKVGAEVLIGRDSLNFDDRSRTVRFIQPRLNRILTDEDYDLDIALLEAYPPVVDIVYPQKPRFVLPPRTPSGSAAIDVLIGGWGHTESVDHPRYRQLQFINDRLVSRVNDGDSDNFHVWFIGFDDPYNGPDSGDSGGPLLWQYDPSDPNKWDLLGGLAQRRTSSPPTAVWADITWSANRQWLEQAAQVGSNVPGRWLGETDYTGPCRTSEDPDCDRYFDRAGFDKCPGLFNPDQVSHDDTDSDGVPDYCDNCMLDPNPNQRNSDGDGYGDACDRCPGISTPSTCDSNCSGGGNRCVEFFDVLHAPEDCFDPSTGDFSDCFATRCARDYDKDGDSAGNACDNCPDASNADQANCNYDAERSTGAALLGDACDSAPCALVTTSQTQLRGSLATDACNSPVRGGTCTVTVNAGIEWRGIVASAPTGVDGATRFGHCNCDRPRTTAEQRIANCQLTGTGAAQCRLGAADLYPVPGTTPSPSGWRAITTTTPRALRTSAAMRRLVPVTFGDISKADLLFDPASAVGVVGAEHPTADYAVTGSPVQGTRWLFDRDLAAFGVTFTPPSGGVRTNVDLEPLARDLRGIGWAFTSSYTGAALSTSQRNRASSYFRQDLEPKNHLDLPPVPPTVITPPTTTITRPGGDPCPTCSITLPPWIWKTINPGLLGTGEMIGMRPGTPPWVTTPGFTGLDSLFAQVGSGVVFVPAAESGGVLSTLGTAERGAFYTIGSGAVTSLQQAPNGEFTGAPLSFETLAPAASDVATFSGARGELYLLRSGGASAAQLFVVNTRETAVAQVALSGVGVGAPLSATYRASDDSIYAADRTSSGALRILRVNRSGAAQELGRVANPGTLRSVVHLAADAAGNLLFTASGGVNDTPLYLTLAPGTTDVRVTGYTFDTRPGRLLLPPVASRDAYAVAKASAGTPVILSEFTRADFTPLGSVALASVESLFRTPSGDDVCTFTTPSVNNDCAQARSLVLYASRQLLIADRATTRTATNTYAPIANGGAISTDIGVDAQVGNLWSKAPVTLRGGRVNGFARSGASITQQNGASISGTVRQNSPVNIVPLAQFALEFPQQTDGNVFLEPPPGVPSLRVLDPGAYGDVMIKARGTLALRSGVYSFTSLAFEPDAVASFDTRNGPIYLYVKSTFRFRGSIVNQGPRADVLVAAFGADNVFLEAPFVGTVVAPNAGITLATVTAGHAGSFFARDIDLRPQTNVRYEPFNYPWVP